MPIELTVSPEKKVISVYAEVADLEVVAELSKTYGHKKVAIMRLALHFALRSKEFRELLKALGKETIKMEDVA